MSLPQQQERNSDGEEKKQQKGGIEVEKILINKEYEGKLQLISSEMDRLTGSLKERNHQLEFERDLLKDSLIFSTEKQNQMSSVCDQIKQLEQQFTSSSQVEKMIDMKTYSRMTEDIQREFSVLKNENAQLRQQNLQFEKNVLDLRTQVQQIQNEFQSQQKDLKWEKERISQQLYEIELNRKCMEQSIYLSRELEKVVTQLQIKNEEIDSIKKQSEKLIKQCDQFEQEKKTLDQIVSFQAQQIFKQGNSLNQEPTLNSYLYQGNAKLEHPHIYGNCGNNDSSRLHSFKNLKSASPSLQGAHQSQMEFKYPDNTAQHDEKYLGNTCNLINQSYRIFPKKNLNHLISDNNYKMNTSLQSFNNQSGTYVTKAEPSHILPTYAQTSPINLNMRKFDKQTLIPLECNTGHLQSPSRGLSPSPLSKHSITITVFKNPDIK